MSVEDVAAIAAESPPEAVARSSWTRTSRPTSSTGIRRWWDWEKAGSASRVQAITELRVSPRRGLRL